MGIVLRVALPGAALLKLITASTILPALTYGLTIVLHLGARRRLDRRKRAFNLGPFELPVAIRALVWSVISLFASPSSSRRSSRSGCGSGCCRTSGEPSSRTRCGGRRTQSSAGCASDRPDLRRRDGRKRPVKGVGVAV